MSFQSLRLRLALAGAATIALALTLAGLGLTALFAAHVERRAVAELTVQLDQVIAGLERQADGTLALATVPADPRFRQPFGGLYWQIEADRLMRSRSLWDNALALPQDELPDGSVHFHRLPGPVGEEVLILERSVALPGNANGTRVRAAVAMDVAELAAAKAGFQAELFVYLAVLGAVLVIAALVQVAFGLRPLWAVGERVAAVRSGTSRRLGTEFPDEVRPLAAEVDALLATREADIERARMRAGDLAHGFKTPLQALLGEAGRLREAGLCERADAVEDIALSMRRHVDRELLRARIAVAARTARCEVRPVVVRLLNVIRHTPDGARLDLDNAVPEALTAAIDPDDLAEALGALLENAARHARRRVRVDAERRTSDVVIVVVDDGPGLSSPAVELASHRGRRFDETGPGEGLGLSIATEIVEVVGGRLVLSDAAPGLRACVELPAADGNPHRPSGNRRQRPSNHRPSAMHAKD